MFGDLRRWLSERPMRQRAVGYVESLLHEPSDDDARWLSSVARGDVDHARWELRYARRALGLQVAGRDALDDRTASVVAEVLTSALRGDRHVATDKLEVVERQLNARLRGYGDALSQRGAGDPTAVRLARVLLAFAGARDPGDPFVIARAGEILGAYVTDANAALREQFGAASLPDDVAPSKLGAKS